MNVEIIRSKFEAFETAVDDWMSAPNRGESLKPKVGDFVSADEADFWLELPIDVRFPEDNEDSAEVPFSDGQFELFA